MSIRIMSTHRPRFQSLPTEAITRATLNLDKLSADEIVEVMLAEDRRMLTAVLKEKARIATGVEFIVTALRKGGRLFFVGAGTSGRLGVLESAEMPPTFSTFTSPAFSSLAIAFLTVFLSAIPVAAKMSSRFIKTKAGVSLAALHAKAFSTARPLMSINRQTFWA